MDSVDEAAGPAAAASRRHRQAEGRPICLSIDLNEIPSPSSDTPSSTPTSGPATAPAVVLLDAYEVALRFHANPPVPQGPLAEFPGEAGVGRVSACGVCSRPETKGDTVVCDRCEKGFHLGCAKIRSRQAFSLDDWICSDCKRRRHDSKRWPLGTVSAADQRGGVRLLDINAPPPSDGDGDGVPGGPPEALPNRSSVFEDTNRPFALDRDSHKSFNGQLPHLDLENRGSGFDTRKRIGILTDNSESGIGSVAFQGLTDMSICDDVFLTSPGTTPASNKDTVRQSTQLQAEVFLQSLKEFIVERQGFLGDGWHVEFKQWSNNHDAYAVFCSPDGNRFDSMVDVARYLGLTSKVTSMNVDERTEASDSLQMPLPQCKRMKGLARLSRTSSDSEMQGIMINGHRGDSSDDEIVEPWQHNTTQDASVTESILEEKNCPSHQLNLGLPVQFADFFISSLGEVDQRPAYHDTRHIWPIGYTCQWHDKITGSLFESEVADGGDSGPVFKVKRRPCSLPPIGDGRIVLSPSVLAPLEGSALEDFSDNDSTQIQMLVSEPDPFQQDFLSCLSNFSENCYDPSISSADNQRVGHSENPLKNEIGEFHVQGRSSSAVWRKVSQTLINLCHEVYSHSGNLKLCCTHAVCGVSSFCEDVENEQKLKKLGPLARFFCVFGPRQVPKVINCESQLEASCESLATWLEHDRFGLDMDFAQEIIERLPGALGCRKYKFLTKRSCYPTSKTVGSGFLSAKGQAMEQYAEEVALSTLYGPKISTVQEQVEELHSAKHFPPGRPLDSRFPLELVGDVVQIWEFLWRFFEILGLGEPISFNELEEELIDPWPIGTARLETFEKEIQETRELSSHSREIAGRNSTFETDLPVSGQRTPLFIQVETGPMREASLAKMASCTYGRCTGNVLAKVHMSLLKVLVGELLSKVSVFAGPSFDPGESKSRRGRKRDVDNSLQAKKAKIDILPLNALSWPELARRYILAVLSTDRSLESSEISCRDGLKIFRCIHGDGGVLCGSLAGVAGMEADALLLAEAYKQISDPLRRENDAWPVEDKDPAVVSLAEPPVNNGLGTPEWAQLLEPVRKLPTNVGTRIRKCIYDSLEKDPPDWARKILEHSISKEVYKGNASGPTKKAVLSVLEAVSGGNLHSKPIKGRKTKHNEPKSDVIMKQCRIVLRQAAAADEDKVFCNLLGSSMSNPNDNDDEGILGFPAMVSRPLDFRTIDLRLAVGAYGGSHEVFVEDVREVWHNIYIAYGDRPDLMELAESLSKNFESLYEKQVLSLVKNFADDTSVGCSNDEATRNRNDLHHANEVPRAPWEEGVCKVCGIDKDDDSVLLCDSCDSEYHTYCLNPPLSKIPDGNWYCPSCVVVQCKNQGSSPSSQGTGRQEHRYLGEYSSMFHEVLNQLVTSMEKREYWELSIEERTFLLKFLCDEVLSSALIREQLEQSVDTSNELQQKIRLIVVEWRNLKFKEDLLIRMSKEISGKVNGTSETLRDEGTANVIATDGKLIGQEHHFSNRSDCQIFVTEENGQIDMNKQVSELFCKRFVFDKHSNANGTRSSSLNEFSDPKVSCDERNSDGLVPKKMFAGENHALILDADGDDGCRVADKSSRLVSQSEISDDKTHKGHLGVQEVTANVSVINSVIHVENDENLLPITESGPRNINIEENVPVKSTDPAIPESMVDLTTSDDKISLSSINVYANATESQTCTAELKSLKNDILRLEESFAVLESQLLMSTLRRDFLGRDSLGRMYWSIVRPCKRPWLLVDGNTSAQQNGDYGGPFIGSAGDASKKDACNVRTCASRSSNSGPKDDTRNSYRLVLYESDQEIHELVCSLRESDPRERELKEGIVQLQRLGSHHVSSDTQVISRPSGMDRVAPPQLLTKAAILLESKYGPCLEPESNDGSRKRARKCKNFEERMRRCECLEPIWPSRHHCLQCHQTFGTRLELEKHTDERCANRVPPGENKESGDSVKGKMGRSDSNYQKESLDETDLIGESRSAVDITPRLPHFQNQLCPHDFKEISRRFIPKGAIKDLVQEIGLIGSNGIPSFIQPDPQSFLDPSLVLVKNEGSDVVLISAEGMAEGDARIESDDTLEQCRKTPGDADYMEIMEISSMPARLNNTLNGSCKDNVSVPGINHTCIVPESSLRPLGGKVSQILKQLKINLLDMDATLPEEALRPLQALSGKRRAWRSLVKSAESIYQMVQATILLEGMIKTDYLKSGWWYWSSLTTAAKTVTISSLALRIYALDASIVYAKTASDPGMAESVKATLSRAGRKKKDMDGGA